MARNTAANVGGVAVVAAIALVTTPVLLQHLGATEYGIWLLATTLTFDNGVLRLSDLGLQPATVKFVAEARGRGDAEEIDRVASTALAILAALGAALAALLVLAAGAIVGLFAVESSMASTATVVFAVVGMTMLLDLPSAALLAVVEGAERFLALRVVEIGTRLLWAVGAVVAVLAGYGVRSVAIAAALAAVVRFVAAVVLAHRVQRGLRLRWGNVRRATAARLVPFGGRLLVLKVLQVAYRQMDRIILGVVLSAAAVAEYEVAYKLHATAAVLLTVAPTAFSPRASYLSTGGPSSRDQLRHLYLQGTRWSLLLCLPVMVAAIVWAGVLVVAWVGPDYADLAGMTRLFMLYPVLGIVHAVGMAMLVGLARVRRMIVLNSLSLAVNLAVSLALVGPMGPTGVVVGTLAGFTVQWVPYLRLMLREFDVELGPWLRSVLLPAVPGVATTVVLGLVTLPWARELRSIWNAGPAFLALCTTGIAVSLLTGLGRDERRRLLSRLRGSERAVAG